MSAGQLLLAWAMPGVAGPLCLRPILRGSATIRTSQGWDQELVALERYKWMAAVLGVMLTGVPVLWLTSWLEKQGEAEAYIMANRAIRIVDLRIGQAATILNDLASRGVNTCEPGHLEVLRQKVLISGPIKEFALVAANGQTLCTDSGLPTERRSVLASAAAARDGLMLDVIEFAGWHERMLRVRRLPSNGRPALSALLPAGLLLPRAWHGGHPRGHARLKLADGTLIGAVGAQPVSDPERYASSRQRSERYGPIVEITMAREGVIANYDDLRRIGMVVSGLLAILILGIALVIPWRQRNSPISEIERALRAGEFVPFYQPIVDVNSGKLLGAEVLARWRRPDGTFMAPATFIPLMESSGRVIEMTRVLMRAVCREAGEALGRRPNMYVAFNITPRHLAESVLLNDVGSVFDGSPIRMSQVVLEVTERDEITNLTGTRRMVAALQSLGCRVAIDDVGTGHSGLSYILKLGVDIIKIDRLFVEAIKTERQSQAIVATLVDLARNLRMQIVAEGVENFEQVLYLREQGISAVQGFVFAPPLPGSAFLQLVETIDPLPTAAVEEGLSPDIPGAPTVQYAAA
jgi:sensor c-di-GMP phosphodiesterase-like protein